MIASGCGIIGTTSEHPVQALGRLVKGAAAGDGRGGAWDVLVQGDGRPLINADGSSFGSSRKPRFFHFGAPSAGPNAMSALLSLQALLDTGVMRGAVASVLKGDAVVGGVDDSAFDGLLLHRIDSDADLALLVCGPGVQEHQGLFSALHDDEEEDTMAGRTTKKFTVDRLLWMAENGVIRVEGIEDRSDYPNLYESLEGGEEKEGSPPKVARNLETTLGGMGGGHRVWLRIVACRRLLGRFLGSVLRSSD